jgi:hypothetical protein
MLAGESHQIGYRQERRRERREGGRDGGKEGVPLRGP